MSETSLVDILNSNDDGINQETLMRILSKIKLNLEDEKLEDYGEDYINKLRSLNEAYNDKIEFKPGQLVVWKDGLKNRKFPYKNQPAIVVKVLETPLYVDKDSGTPYFQEPLDIALAVIGGEKSEFLIYYYDKRRFRLYATE